MKTPFLLQGHNPDVLSCIANLSNDEVFTPPHIANQMLDSLTLAWSSSNEGADIWEDSTVTFLDPFAKSGIFLREIVRRLTVGLAGTIPDLDERLDHILTKQVYGIAITELTGMLARRSVYCSKFANGRHSIAKSFTNETGNIWFERTEHTWGGGKREFRADPLTSNEIAVYTRQRCIYCGAGADDYGRGQDLETHAYAFIHTDDIKARIAELFGADMQFDIIVGNPPYQLGDGGGGGGVSATPIYNKFVEKALALAPRHAVMITPSRWFSGGKGLDEFRDKMLRDRRLAKLVDYPQLYDVFPGVKIRGGVSYWLWSRDYNGDCEVTTKIGEAIQGEPMSRRLDAYDVLVRRNEAVEILEHVMSYRIEGKKEPRLGDQVSPRKPFGLTNQVGGATPSGIADPILVYGNQITSYMPRTAISTNHEWVDRWKVLLVKAHGTSGRDDVTILGTPVIAAPGTACTETYLVIGVCESESEASNLAAYMRTRFVRFLVSLRKISQNITRDSYKFVPVLPFDRTWTDALLYERYGLTPDEIAFVESQVVARDASAISDGTAEDDDD